MSDSDMTLDEWVANYKLSLALDIAGHIKEIVKDPDDVETLLRWIMIAVREDSTSIKHNSVGVTVPSQPTLYKILREPVETHLLEAEDT